MWLDLALTSRSKQFSKQKQRLEEKCYHRLLDVSLDADSQITVYSAVETRRKHVFPKRNLTTNLSKMPQGKIKVKTAMPTNVKGKKVKKLDKVPPKRKVQRKCFAFIFFCSHILQNMNLVIVPKPFRL